MTDRTMKEYLASCNQLTEDGICVFGEVPCNPLDCPLEAQNNTVTAETRETCNHTQNKVGGNNMTEIVGTIMSISEEVSKTGKPYRRVVMQEDSSIYLDFQAHIPKAHAVEGSKVRLVLGGNENNFINMCQVVAPDTPSTIRVVPDTQPIAPQVTAPPAKPYNRDRDIKRQVYLKIAGAVHANRSIDTAQQLAKRITELADEI